MSFDYSKLATLKPKNLQNQEVSRSIQATPTPVETPVETPVTTPAGTPAFTPVETPVGTPVVTPVETPAAPRSKPLSEAKPAPAYEGSDEQLTSAARSAPARRQFDPIDATHTASEQKIFSVMYRHEHERHWGYKELSRLTGIRSDTTIRKAIDGLIAKRSIEIVSYRHGNPLGPRYRIFAPKEIQQRRAEAGIEIDTQTKLIGETPVETPAATPVETPAATGVATGVSDSRRNYGSTPVETTGVHPYLLKNININNHDPDHGLDYARWMRAKLSEESDEDLRIAGAEIATIVTEFLERAANRASKPPTRANFFVKCLRIALSEKNDLEGARTPKNRSEANSAQMSATQSNVRELVRAVAYEFRQANHHNATYTDVDLQRDLEQWCAEQEIADAESLIANALATTSEKGSI